MTTKLDLLRDCLIDLLIDFDFNFDSSDDGDASDRESNITRDTVIEDMVSMLEDFDENAQKSDYLIKVIIDKEAK